MKEGIQLYKFNNSDSDIKKDIFSLEQVLTNLKNAILAFSGDDISYLQESYIELSHNVLEISMNFKNAKYFFLSKNFKTNVDANYEECFFKDSLLELENICKQISRESDIKDSLDYSNQNIVSIFALIENIARKYDKGEDSSLFKKKLIDLYNAFYATLLNFSDTLTSKYFDIVLCNHPAILIALIKGSLKATSLKSAFKSLSNDSLIKQCNNYVCTVLDDALLAELISILSIPNPNFSSLVYSKENAKVLNLDYSLLDFDNFELKSKDFIKNYEVLEGLNKTQSIISCELFIKYATKRDAQNISKNILLIGPIGSGKNALAKNMAVNKNCRVINISKAYQYENFMDGFVNGKFMDGEFKLACKEAINDSKNNYYVILNNINYADINTIFGEILELLDNRYDGTDDSILIRSKNSYIIDTLDNPKDYSVVYKNEKSYFAIPENLYIIATYDLGLNLKSSDMPLMAKFNTIPVECNYSAIESALSNVKNSQNFIKACENLNKVLSKISPNARIGHMVFLKIKDKIKNNQISSQDAIDFYQKELNFIILALLCELPENVIQDTMTECAGVFKGSF